MNCPNCGSELQPGQKFCGKCGTVIADQSAPADLVQPTQQAPQQAGTYQQPVQQPGQTSYAQPPYGQSAYDQPPYGQPPYGQPPYGQPPKKKSKTGLIILIVVLAIVLIIGGAIAWFVHSVKKAADNYLEDIESFENELDDWEDPDIDDLDLDALNEELDDIYDTNMSEFEEIESDISGDAEDYAYSYTDVTIDGTNIVIKPNGKLNGSTVFYNGKDLEGLLDYIDGNVLETGRYINRDFFYDLLATMQVDESLYSNFDDIEANMIMCLAMANNFHNIDVRVKECDLDANNAAEYHYQVKAEGKDDIWIVNYADRTVYFNDGKTEYSSDMFNDEYLAIWWSAIDEYYDHQSF